MTFDVGDLYPVRMWNRRRRVTAGAVLIAMALLGWMATMVAVPFLQKPHTTEDLTAAWKQAGPTPLGQSTTVSVPPGQTLVAFLVGTQIYGPAGTTGGTCAASGDGHPVNLGWPVYIDTSLTNELRDGQEIVAISGWTNDSGRTVRVDITCGTGDSTIDHFVAVPTRTAVVAHAPWFQPWSWVAMALAGLAVLASGVEWLSQPSR